MEKINIPYKSELFFAICTIVLVYFLYSIIFHIIKSIKRKHSISTSQKSLLTANSELALIKSEIISEISTIYNAETADNISKNIIWIGMPKKLLLIAKGIPDDIKESYLDDTVVQKYYYEKHKTLINTFRYKLEVIVEDDEVIGWNDL